MAAATAKVTVTQTDVAGKLMRIFGTLAISASPATYTPGGIALDFNDPLIKSASVPIFVQIQGQAGYIYSYIPGTDNTTGLLKIATMTSTPSAREPLFEYPNATAIDAALSGDVISFLAFFPAQY